MDVLDLTQESDDEVSVDCNTVPDNSQGTSLGSNGSSQSSTRSRGRPKRKSVDSLGDKTRKKNNAADREAKKKQIAQQKAAKAAAMEKNKIYKPGECMKYMQIEVHPTLSSAWYMADVPREATTVGCKIVPSTDICDPSLLMWTRLLQPTLAVSDGQLGLSKSERCSRALYISLADDLSEMVISHTLTNHMRQVQDLAGCQLTLVVCGVKDYFKTTGRKTVNSNRKRFTEIDLEMAITDLLVGTNCDTICVESPNDLAILIVQITKAIAEEPYKKAKRACEEQADFFMRGDNKKCVAIDKNGNGLSRLWQQMIAILPHSSLEVSRAVCAKYKNPLELYEALQSPNSVNELADMGVSRAAVPGARARRLGPEFARKLRTLFTAENGNILID